MFGSNRETDQAAPAAASRIPGSTTPHPESEHQAHLLEIRHQDIAVRAYFRAERRGFAPGGELEDWLIAEQEIDDESRSL